MKKADIEEVLQMAYKSYSEDGIIPKKANIADFLIKAVDWDLCLKINLYFAKKEQVENATKEMFDFNYE